MKAATIGCLSVIGILVIGFFITIGWGISTSNKEVGLRTLVEAKQLDNTSEFDNMSKKICQVAQVSEKQLAVLKDIFVSYADARTSPDAGKMMSWVQESIPNVDTSTMNQLVNIITASRDSWTMRQKELIDIKREHELLLRKFPSSALLSFLGRESIDITVITSSKTQKVFETGVDDDVNVFSTPVNSNIEE